MLAINSKKKHEIVVVAYVLDDMQNLVISRCCFAEDGYVMYKDL